MIKSILFGRWGDRWKASLLWRFFYRLKALICCLLNREPARAAWLYGYMHINLTYTDGGTSWSEYGTQHWAEVIVVGKGILSNWWCTYYQGSD